MDSSDKKRAEECAAELNAKLVYDADRCEGPEADVKLREVHLAKDSSFMATMHELGHVATTPACEDNEVIVVTFPWGGDAEIPADPVKTFTYECQAWLWGMDHAGRSLTDGERETIAYSLGTYMIGTHEAYGAYPTAPDTDPSVIEIARRVGTVDFKHAAIMKWRAGEQEHWDLFDYAWNYFLMNLTSDEGQAFVQALKEEGTFAS